MTLAAPANSLFFGPSPHAADVILCEASVQDVPDALTFPSYRAVTDPSIIRIVARQTGAPGEDTSVVGAVLVELAGANALVLSIAVTPAFRRLGIGTRLLAGAAARARADGARHLSMVYTTRAAGHQALERMLARQGWPDPQTRMIFGRTHPRSVWRQDWVQRQIVRTPRNSTVFDWADLTGADRDFIAAQIADGLYPAEVSPLWEEPHLAPISLGLRDAHGLVVGWLVCHFVPEIPGVIRYSRLFSASSRAFRGNGPWMMAMALNRHINSPLGETHPVVLFDVDCRNWAMLAVCERRITAHLDERYESRGTALALKAP